MTITYKSKLNSIARDLENTMNKYCRVELAAEYEFLGGLNRNDRTDLANLQGHLESLDVTMEWMKTCNTVFTSMYLLVRATGQTGFVLDIEWKAFVQTSIYSVENYHYYLKQLWEKMSGHSQTAKELLTRKMGQARNLANLYDFHQQFGNANNWYPQKSDYSNQDKWYPARQTYCRYDQTTYNPPTSAGKSCRWTEASYCRICRFQYGAYGCYEQQTSSLTSCLSSGPSVWLPNGDGTICNESPPYPASFKCDQPRRDQGFGTGCFNGRCPE